MDLLYLLISCFAFCDKRQAPRCYACGLKCSESGRPALDTPLPERASYSSARAGAPPVRGKGFPTQSVRPTRSNLLPAWRSADLRQLRRKVMPRPVTPDLTLDGLKKEAKRWLKAIRANDADCARAIRARPSRRAPAPTLRDCAARARARVRARRLDDAETDVVESPTATASGRDQVAGRGGVALPRQRLPRPSRARRIRSRPRRAHGDASPGSPSGNRDRELLYGCRLRRSRRGESRPRGRPGLGDAPERRARARDEPASEAKGI